MTYSLNSYTVKFYESQIISLQSNIRRRQATIRTIKKLHLTGSL